MEQFVLYLAILAALSGFAMGLVNLAGPFLKRHNIALPALDIASFLRRGDRDEDDDLDLILGDDFAEGGFAAPGRSLLARRRLGAGDGEDDEELDEELATVLEEVAEEEILSGVDDELMDDAEESPVVYTVPAGAAELEGGEDSAEQRDVLAVLDEAFENEIDDEDASDDQVDEADDDEDDDEDDDDEAPEVQTVSAAGGGEGDDMMSFFDEAADAGAGPVAVWQEDLPQVSIEELLAEARAISQQIKGKKSNAA